MKQLAWLLLWPLAVQAADVREDYAQAWPLRLAVPDAGAYQLTLTEPVYRALRSPTLADLQPIDADGAPLPAALAGTEVAVSSSDRRVPLPLFALPAQPVQAGSDDLTLIAERGADGAIRRIEARSGAGGDAARPAWLADASALEATPRALWLDWQADPGEPLQADVRVDASDDLRTWRLLEPRVTLMQLSNGRERLQQRRIPLAAGGRYLRITALGATMPALRGVAAEPAPDDARAPLQWLALHGQADGRGHVFELPGRFPVAAVDVETGANDAGEWIVQSRDDPQAPWVQRAGPWLSYRLGSGRSAPQPLSQPSRDRYWRLQPREGASASAPVLRLGWRGETLLFLTRGPAPYALAAGSARAAREDAPLADMLGALRRARGAHWQPAAATLAGPGHVLAGDAALVASTPRDWTSWLLWGVLVLGALIVAGFALSLVRGGGETPR